MKKHLLLAIAILAAASGCKRQDDPTEQRIDELLAQMTLDEKVGQLNQLNGSGWVSPDLSGAIKGGAVGSILNEVNLETVNELQRIAVEESRLHIPLIFARDVIHGFRTMFPIPLGQAATWNPEVVERGARVAAVEASSCGVRWTFSPMLDISRDPRWGRIAESFGEDTYLTTVLGDAMTRGYQTDDLSNPTSMAACAKHFCAYGASESGRDYNTTWIPEVQLRDTYLPPFKSQVKNGAATFMCSFNDINGTPSTGNKHLNVDILRNEWGYDGLLVTDWASIAQMIPHGFSADLRAATRSAIDSRVGMDMMSFGYITHLKDLVEKGEVSIGEVDNAVRDVLRLKIRLGLFEHPYAQNQDSTLCEQFRADAREACVQSTILLKNNGILPLKDFGRVAVVGPLADSGVDQIGTWSFDGVAADCVTPAAALREALGDKVVVEPGLTYSRDKSGKDVEAALAAARKADVVLFFAGEEAILSGEAKCRADISLPGAQKELLRRLKDEGMKVVLVVMAGRQLTIGDEVEMADAVLYQFHGGTMAGPALADVLLGKECPSGRLPVTMPRMVGQVPMYYNHKNTGRPAENITMIDDIPIAAPQFSLGSTSYHLDAGDSPLFPFGFGLSYTTFKYGTVDLSSGEVSMTDTLTVNCDITNVGERDAYEVPQLYVRDKVASLCRPIRELKGFRKVFIKAGETVRVSFKITADDLAFCHNDMKTFAEPGDFDVWVSSDAASGAPVTFTLK
ncbi:MAG: glycoside hydrolase family 3 N-terminal domain-containing protein [Marinilabiliaceae bacterium]